MGADVDRIYAAENVDPFNDEGLDLLAHRARVLRPDLIIVDPLVAYIGAGSTFTAPTKRARYSPASLRSPTKHAPPLSRSGISTRAQAGKPSTGDLAASILLQRRGPFSLSARTPKTSPAVLSYTRNRIWHQREKASGIDLAHKTGSLGPGRRASPPMNSSEPVVTHLATSTNSFSLNSQRDRAAPPRSSPPDWSRVTPAGRSTELRSDSTLSPNESGSPRTRTGNGNSPNAPKGAKPFYGTLRASEHESRCGGRVGRAHVLGRSPSSCSPEPSRLLRCYARFAWNTAPRSPTGRLRTIWFRFRSVESTARKALGRTRWRRKSWQAVYGP